MTTAESMPCLYGEMDHNISRTRQTITDEMLTVAAPGQDELDEFTIRKLSGLTSELLIADGEFAAAEYDRYTGVKERGLDIDRGAIAERIAGKSVLVTGGTGLIGSALLKELGTLGATRLASISRGVTQPTEQIAGVDYFNGDIRNPSDVGAVMEEVKPDIVFHVAADKYNHEAEARAKFTLTTNIAGTKNVIETAKANGVQQLVFASTGKATRPYSPDIYASSKKTGEWLMTGAAEDGMLSSAVRFTHVVDDSNVRKKINECIDDGNPVRLQGPDVLFYIQSAKESAHLLLNSLLEAEPGVLNIQAMRDLAMPINLLGLGLGAVAKKNSKVPIYFGGVEKGYEDVAWPGLYDPLTGGDVSPLINAIEATEATESTHCPAVDTFPLKIARSAEAELRLKELLEACNTTTDNGTLRETNQALGWAMLDARLNALPWATLNRTAARAAKFAMLGNVSSEHERTDAIITDVYQASRPQ